MDLHPPCSGLPLAGALTLIFSEAIILVPSLRRSRPVLRAFAVALCLVAVSCAFLSGYQATNQAGDLSESVETVLATHHALGRLLLINSVLLAVFYFVSRIAVHGRRLILVLYYVTVALQIFLTARVGILGGDLVFNHGVHVQQR